MAELGIPVQWLESWNAQLSTIAGAIAAFCGLLGLFAADTACKVAGFLQIITGVLVVAIEGPNFLPQLAFAAPLASVFDGKPDWIKVAVYAVLTIVPSFAGCFKILFLGFLASVIVTALHGLLLYSRRRSHEEFGVQPVTPPAGGVGNSTQSDAFSAASP